MQWKCCDPFPACFPVTQAVRGNRCTFESYATRRSLRPSGTRRGSLTPLLDTIAQSCPLFTISDGRLSTSVIKVAQKSPSSHRLSCSRSQQKSQLATIVTSWLFMEAAGIEPASRDISMQASTCVVDPICTLCRRTAPGSTGLPLDQPAAVFNLGRRRRRPETIRNYSRQSELSGKAPQPGSPC